ncbi:MAG: hypothetical protein JXA33_14160 [Anaerolineae bacterium]|nr:hypothetical protein [Anaerolineae bacterium]
MEQSIDLNQITAEFFADGYRVSGHFDAARYALADTLLDPTTNYISIINAYLSPVMDPSVLTAHYKIATVDKSQLDFVLTVNARDGIRRDQHYAQGMKTHTVFLTLPFFEVSGELRTAMTVFKPRSYLSTTAGSFLTFLNVTARCTFNPSIVYQGGAAQINRTKITFFGERSLT